MSKTLKISILVDNPDSWIVPFAQDIQRRLAEQHDANLYFKASDIPEGDMLFLLGCTSIIPREILQRNKNNLVVHESDLPKGRGWSPITWQVLEGKNRIPIVVFEATEELDAGPIYLKDCIEFNGSELLPELKKKQGEKTVELALQLIDMYPNLVGTPQEGKPSVYPKRSRKDDEIDPSKSIAECFNQLRVLNNEEFPAWFSHRGHTYKLNIYKSS